MSCVYNSKSSRRQIHQDVFSKYVSKTPNVTSLVASSLRTSPMLSKTWTKIMIINRS